MATWALRPHREVLVPVDTMREFKVRGDNAIQYYLFMPNCKVVLHMQGKNSSVSWECKGGSFGSMAFYYATHAYNTYKEIRKGLANNPFYKDFQNDRKNVQPKFSRTCSITRK